MGEKIRDICLSSQVKVQWTEQLVATQQQKTEQIKKETEQIKVSQLLLYLQMFYDQAVADANRQKAVLEIKIQENIIEVEGKRNVSIINNQILQVLVFFVNEVIFS